MAAKPRTNDAAANYWADGILTTERTPYLHVNSVHCEGDAIYSFGHHFPMALIERAPSGRVKRVILNTDNYPHRGWANTSGDQYNVKHAVMDRVSKVKRNIPVLSVPLTAYRYRANAGLQIRPNPNDPEPEAYSSIRVPVPFHAYNPGPEPVKPAAGCIAGREEEYSYATEHHIWLDSNGHPLSYSRPMLPGDWIVGRGRNHIIVERWANGVLRWTDERTWGGSTSETKQCPHCRAFDELHAKWSEGMHGGHRREPGVVFGNHTTVYRRTRGYAEYRKWMDEFGSTDAWRAARKADVKRVREVRKARAAWVERNFMPLMYVPKVARYSKVPKLDPDGFVYPSHAKAYLVEKRKLDRARADVERRQAEVAKRKRTLARTWRKRYGLRGIEQEVADWCIEYGLEPNDDNTITVVKAVKPDYHSNHGHPYLVGTGVVSYDWSPSAHCGNGLHFGPTREIALSYHGIGHPVRYLECRVPLANLACMGTKCKSRYAVVVREIA